MWAATRGLHSSIESLFKGGANINTKDIKGMTALMHSVLCLGGSSAMKDGSSHCMMKEGNSNDIKHLLVIKILLDQKDIDINCKSASGSTAISLAIEHGDYEVAEILRGHGAIES
jgi:ankyrin repeat protein